MLSLVCVGDNTVDTYLDRARQFPGGNAVNVAAFAARLGAVSAYLGVTADDARGRLILGALAEEGVDLSHCRMLPGETAWACVTHRDGDREFLGSIPGVCRQLRLDSGDLAYLRGFDLAHTSLYSGLDDQLARIAAACPRLSFDFSDDWSENQLRQLAPCVKIAFLSDANISDDQGRALLTRVCALGPEVAILTRGANGVLALARGQWCSQAVRPTEVVDTLGAGDGFIAAFLLRWHSGGSLAASLGFAADHAASVCRSAGGFGHGIDADEAELQRIQQALGIRRR